MNWDEEAGKELIVLSAGMNYYSGKVLDFVDNQLKEVVEIEGFEAIYEHNNSTLLIGHKVTDSALLDGTSELYYQYKYNSGVIEKGSLDMELYVNLS